MAPVQVCDASASFYFQIAPWKGSLLTVLFTHLSFVYKTTKSLFFSSNPASSPLPKHPLLLFLSLPSDETVLKFTKMPMSRGAFDHFLKRLVLNSSPSLESFIPACCRYGFYLRHGENEALKERIRLYFLQTHEHIWRAVQVGSWKYFNNTDGDGSRGEPSYGSARTTRLEVNTVLQWRCRGSEPRIQLYSV